MRIVVSALHFAWSSMDECLDRARSEFGLDGVELSFHGSFDRPHCTIADIESLTDGTRGLHVCAHIWDDLASLDGEEACRKLDFWRALAAEKGIPGLVIHGGSYPDRHEGIRRTIRVLERMIPLFERSRIRLLLENHYAYEYRDCRELFSAAWEFRAVFDRIRSPALRFCFDTGHANLTGNGEDLLLALMPYLAHVHLADNRGENDDHCMYGEGTVPWRRYFDILERNGFDGTMCVEFPVRENRAPFDECVGALRAYAGRVRRRPHARHVPPDGPPRRGAANP